ncbi:Rne/Rng family ribonuclease [Buchnera aphidicola (Ceratoglyphina bambusae)]|uniref:Rne/Rng family ribonuclease n=1 Tax=Buchnera aphidicola TaxID=9 RepID=UPI0031B7FCB5
MKRMLINSIKKEETRIAILENKKLCDLKIENNINKKNKFNIYKGKIIKFENSLDAVFVDYGVKKNGFLPLKEISDEYFNKEKNYKNISIKCLIKKKLELLVQINKEEIETKGAFLTTYISLPSTYTILMPYNFNKEGISRKITGDNRKEIKSLIKTLKIPNNMGFIIRTAGLGKSIKTLQKDINIKIKLWNKIKKISKNISSPMLVHKESDIIVRSFRDYLHKDVDEIIIDNPNVLNVLNKHFYNLGKLSILKKIKLYKKKIPLFSFYKIESQISSIFKRKIQLNSGGSITIDCTEALIAIDINSFKSNKYKSIEETAFNTNMEAIDEIFYQIKIRDLGGLIVIDFIDMEFNENKKILENRIKKLIKKDTAKIEISKISKFGLLEISRQRLSSKLKEYNYKICSNCNGSGIIINNEDFSLSILRILEEEVSKKDFYKIYIIVPYKISYYFVKKKINYIKKIEKREKNIKIIIFFNKKVFIPNFFIFRICKNKKKQINIKKILKNNYKINIKKLFLQKL